MSSNFVLDSIIGITILIPKGFYRGAEQLQLSLISGGAVNDQNF